MYHRSLLTQAADFDIITSCRNAFFSFNERRARNLTLGQRGSGRDIDFPLPFRLISSKFSAVM